MKCFPFSGDTSPKKQEKKNIGNNHVNSDKNRIIRNANINVVKDNIKNKPIGRRHDQETHAKDTSEGIQKKSVKEEETKAKKDAKQSSPRSVILPNVKGQNKNAVKAKSFTFSELMIATENFEEKNFLGQGGFGRVYKGHLKDTNEVVAIKQLDIHGCQGIREFVVEVMTLSMADHPNLVKLIGYCVSGEQRLLVYEYMPLGSLEDHLFGEVSKRKDLDWHSRMKIAAGAAKGLEYLHGTMNPPIIYRDVKCSNILLGEGYDTKLSDFGLAKVGPSGDKTHVSTRVMGTYGYCAPDYALTGQLTFKSDIYSFGVVLLELITGRRAIDHDRPSKERNLVDWARPLFKDRKKFHEMADPILENQYPSRGLYQTLMICAMCIQDQPSQRPTTQELVHALTFLASKNNKETTTHIEPIQTSVWSLSPSPKKSDSEDEIKA
ncbi:hypothetical protein Leryth_009480 [Lithospermum erythrorhizon]|nr:hypothetical protein Leryth_009480 [Lithospermum erythrorhizon]